MNPAAWGTRSSGMRLPRPNRLAAPAGSGGSAGVRSMRTPSRPSTRRIAWRDAGLALTPALSCQNTLVGLAAPAGAVAEAFTWTTAAMFGGVAAGSTVAGALVDRAGVGAPFAAASAAVALAAVLAAVDQRPSVRRRPRGAPAMVGGD